MGLGVSLAEVLTEEDLSRINTFSNSVSASLEGLRASYDAGEISQKTFKAGMKAIQKQMNSLNTQYVLLDNFKNS
jgi:hypothetical protein